MAPVTLAAGDSVAERIAQDLERDIILGRTKPGQRLGEEDLAGRFAASRHQVRQGLAHLERLGIVVRERNRGAAVRSFTADEVRQIYDVREILQRQAALRIDLPADRQKIERLRAIQIEYEHAIGKGNLHRIHAANDLFHTELFRLSGNDVLVALVKHYMDLTYVIRATSFFQPESLERSRRHHAIMIDLLRGDDPWALAQICVDHIQPSKMQYLANLASSGRKKPESSRQALMTSRSSRWHQSGEDLMRAARRKPGKPPKELQTYEKGSNDRG